MKCKECVDKPCENNPYNPDQECWQPLTLIQAIASGSVELVEKIKEAMGVKPDELSRG